MILPFRRKKRVLMYRNVENMIKYIVDNPWSRSQVSYYEQSRRFLFQRMRRV